MRQAERSREPEDYGSCVCRDEKEKKVLAGVLSLGLPCMKIHRMVELTLIDGPIWPDEFLSMAIYRKTVRRYHGAGDLHLFTFNCYQRLALLTDPRVLCDLSRRIDKALLLHKCKLIAFVYMPEHVHMLVRPSQPMFESEVFLKSFKQPLSRFVHRLWETENDPALPRLMVHYPDRRQTFRFWQQGGGHDRNIRGERKILNASHYIHRNPVKRGLATTPMDWKWSSARFYREDSALTNDPDLPELHWPTADLFD